VGRDGSLEGLVDDFLDAAFVLVLVGVVDLGGFGVGGGVGVGIGEEGADGGEDGPDIVDGAPLVLEDWLAAGVLSRQMRPSL
jgi:hypothetical protein